MKFLSWVAELLASLLRPRVKRKSAKEIREEMERRRRK